MERQTKMSKNKKDGFEKRSPLQHLSGLQIRKPNCKKTSNLSSSSVSSNSSSVASSSSSSSRTHFHRMPKNLSTVTNNASLKSSAVTLKARSKENEVPKKPSLHKSMKNQPPCLGKKQFGKTNTKPTIKNVQQSSKSCSARRNPGKILKKWSEKMEAKLKNSEEDCSGELPTKLFEVSNDINLHCVENCTPERKIASVCGLDSVSSVYPRNVKEDSISETANGKNSDTSVKTPPVEASVSPEIQSVSHSKILVTKSTATPVCYGAGHLLSGTTDKRKCRRIGSLKGVCEKINLFADEKSYENVISDLRDTLIPLPGEASVRWVLSPSGEGREDSENRLCGNVSDFVCDNSNKKVHENENDSALSFGSLSSGNVIQTPSSDSSSYGCLGGSKLDFVQFELDSITKTLNKVGLSPSGINLTQVQENVNSVCSWVSDSTLLENLALSQTRVSWRDGFISRIDENDEFDCCRCLSDEEIDGDVCSDKRSQSGGEKENDLAKNSYLRSRLGTGCGEDEESDPRIYRDEFETCASARGKEKICSHGLSASAESICTNGGELIASGDSDWMYFRENDLFRAK